MRTCMSGGVRGVRSNAAPASIIVIRRCELFRESSLPIQHQSELPAKSNTQLFKRSIVLLSIQRSGSKTMSRVGNELNSISFL